MTPPNDGKSKRDPTTLQPVATRVGSSTVFDPDLLDRPMIQEHRPNPQQRYQDHLPSNNTLNLHDPEQLEAHLEVQDIRSRLRLRRRRAIRWCAIGFTVIVSMLLVGIAMTSSGGAGDSEDSGQTDIDSMPILPPPPNTLAQACSAANLQSAIGLSACESTCEIAECCNFPQGFELRCYERNVQTCSLYQQHCSILQTLVNTSPTASPAVTTTMPAPVAQATSVPNAAPIDNNDNNNVPTMMPANMELKNDIDQACDGLSSPAQLVNSNCQALCQSGLCCADNSCSDDTQCSVYTNCQAAFQLQNNGPTHSPVDTPALEAACEKVQDNIDKGSGNDDTDGVEIITVNPDQQDAARECQEMCSDAACCFNDVCVPPAYINCYSYLSCQVLFIDSTTNIAPTLTIADQIHAACYRGKIAISAAASTLPSSCQVHCQPAACCFDSSSATCNVNCMDYAECNSFYVPEKMAWSHNDISDICSGSATISKNAVLCDAICAPSEICCRSAAGAQCDTSVLHKETYCKRFSGCEGRN